MLIVDTAGRLAIDEEMMDEITELHGAINPVETLFVVDAMTGQDAANTAKAFNEALPLTGVVLTKVDADTRGGAALSVRAITGKPIKFLGVGEKTEALEPFHPDRLASRILGMGDVLSLIEEAEQKIDKKKAEKLAKQGQEGQALRPRGLPRPAPADEQYGRHHRHAGQAARHGRHGPGRPAEHGHEAVRPHGGHDQLHDPGERRRPELIQGSRKRRITAGLRHPGPGPEPPAEAAQADAEDDEEDEGRRHGKDDARASGGMMGGGGRPPRAVCRRECPPFK